MGKLVSFFRGDISSLASSFHEDDFRGCKKIALFITLGMSLSKGGYSRLIKVRRGM